MESLLAKILGMGWGDGRSLDWKKWSLKKREDGKPRKILLFESLQQTVRNWGEREKSEPTECVDSLDVCGIVVVGGEQTIDCVFGVQRRQNGANLCPDGLDGGGRRVRCRVGHLGGLLPSPRNDCDAIDESLAWVSKEGKGKE